MQHGSCLRQEAREMSLMKAVVGSDWQNIFTLKMDLYCPTQWVILIGALARRVSTNANNHSFWDMVKAPGLNFSAVFCKLPQICVDHGPFSLRTALCSPLSLAGRRGGRVPPLTPVLQQLLLGTAAAPLAVRLAGKTEDSGWVPLLDFHNAYLMS